MRADTLRRLERANPLPAVPDAADTRWAAELLSTIVSDEGHTPTQPTPRRRIGRRGVALAIAATLIVGAGAGLAAIAINRQAPAATQQSVRRALALPAPDRAALTPVRGGIREAFRAQTPYGTWVIDTIQTKGKGVLILSGLLGADGIMRNSGIGGCPAKVLDLNPVIGWCGGGNYALAPDPHPLFDIEGRLSPEVASVELSGTDGRIIPGYVDGGFWLVLLDSLPPGDSHVVAKDAAGRMIGDQLLTRSNDFLLPAPALGSG